MIINVLIFAKNTYIMGTRLNLLIAYLLIEAVLNKYLQSVLLQSLF